MIKKISVFCGSSIGKKPAYRRGAEEMGRLFAANGLELVYGGGNIGMMGAIADAVLEKGGTVTGVIPEGLIDKEIAHGQVTEMHVVEDLMERKKMMIRISDAFIVLPGGFGTLDEMFEVVTMLQLGYIRKPAGILNTEHYYDDLIKMMNKGVQEQFVKPLHRENIIVEDEPEALLNRILEFQPVENEPKWIDQLRKENRYL